MSEVARMGAALEELRQWLDHQGYRRMVAIADRGPGWNGKYRLIDVAGEREGTPSQKEKENSPSCSCSTGADE